MVYRAKTNMAVRNAIEFLLTEDKVFIGLLCDTILEGWFLFQNNILGLVLQQHILSKICVAVYDELYKKAQKNKHRKKYLGTIDDDRKDMFYHLKNNYALTEPFMEAYKTKNKEQFVAEYVKYITYETLRDYRYELEEEIINYNKIKQVSKKIAIDKIKRNAIYNKGLGLKLAVKEYSKDF